MILNNDQVKAILPHRDPFLFIDSVESVVIPGIAEKPGEKYYDIKDIFGVTTTANYRTRANHPIFAGHFPGNPILPGVVQVEMMAQASSFFSLYIVEKVSDYKMEVALVSIENAKFRKPVLPEMDLVLKTTLVKARGPMIYSSCELFHDGQLMSEATVMASFKLTKI